MFNYAYRLAKATSTWRSDLTNYPCPTDGRKSECPVLRQPCKWARSVRDPGSSLPNGIQFRWSTCPIRGRIVATPESMLLANVAEVIFRLGRKKRFELTSAYLNNSVFALFGQGRRLFVVSGRQTGISPSL